MRMVRMLAALLLVALAGALAGCAKTRVMPEGSYARHGAAVSAPRYGATTIVQRGDTLYGIAFRNGLDFRDVAAWNGIGPPYTIYPGQRLRLYPESGAARRLPQGEGGRAGAATAARPAPAPARPGVADRPAAPAAVPSPPVSSGLAWRWPADGELVGRFAAGDPTRQGIDIAGKAGDPVRAAADGVVVYSGSGLVGYGELVIVKHNEAWLSAYGHNRARKVNEGQLVKAGQQIAEMGRSGAARDMLHFEIRYNGKPVDPLLHLPRR
ncbi:MAG: peptidoglycan DD-metalloendopeptidase family protein [Gammaproteobacteria bacterium]